MVKRKKMTLGLETWRARLWLRTTHRSDQWFTRGIVFLRVYCFSHSNLFSLLWYIDCLYFQLVQVREGRFILRHIFFPAYYILHMTFNLKQYQISDYKNQTKHVQQEKQTFYMPFRSVTKDLKYASLTDKEALDICNNNSIILVVMIIWAIKMLFQPTIQNKIMISIWKKQNLCP